MGLAGERREVGVLARHNSVPRLEFDSAAEMLMSARDVTRHCLHQRQRVMHVVGIGRQFEGLFEVRSRLFHFSRVQQGNAVVVKLLGGPQVDRGLLQAAVAHADMESRAMRHVSFGSILGL